MGKLTDGLLVTDAHCDTLVRRHNKRDAVDLTMPCPSYQIDLPRLRTGGVDCLFCMVGDRNLDDSVSLIDAVYRMCEDGTGDYMLCRSAGDVRAAWAAGKISIVMTIEGQVMFGERLSHLRTWHRLGVRIAGLTHGDGQVLGDDGLVPPELQYSDSYFGYLTQGEREILRRQSKGLTPFAREALAEMARLAMPVDLAHCNDAAFWQIMEETDVQVCYTHGAAYALCPHSRSLTDEMLQALAQRGGVMGIAFYAGFIDREAPTIDRLADHFMHALTIMGPDHVGIGSDFDGLPMWSQPVLADVSRMDDLFQALDRRGVDHTTLAKIAGENVIRLLPP